jgi:hypothetical protein
MNIQPVQPGLKEFTNGDDIKCPSCRLIYKFTEFGPEKFQTYEWKEEKKEESETDSPPPVKTPFIHLRITFIKSTSDIHLLDCICNRCHARFYIA